MQDNRKYFYTAIKNNENFKNEQKKCSDYTLYTFDFTEKYCSTYTDGGIFINDISFVKTLGLPNV